MDTATFLVQCLNAVQYGLLLFLVASGLTLIFGIMGVINLAHGSFYMLGAYLAFALAPWFGDWFVTRLVVGVLLAALFGYVLEWAFFSFLYERDHLQQVLLTYALILVFEEMRSLLVGNDVHGVAAPSWLAGGFRLGALMEYPWYRVFASAACLVVALALYAVVNRTRLGMMIRAGASNRDMVRGLGVDIRRLYRIVFAGGVALAALAGMIAAPLSSVYPGHGVERADHLLRRRRHRRHRLDHRRARRVAPGRLRRHLRQGLLRRVERRRRLRADGDRPRLAPRRADEAWLLKPRRRARPTSPPTSARCPTSAATKRAAGAFRRRPRSSSPRCRSSSRRTLQDLVVRIADLRDLRAQPRAARRRDRPRQPRPRGVPRHRRLRDRARVGRRRRAASCFSCALAVGAAAAYAVVVGALSLRTRGVYFIMVTLAFAQMAYFVVHDTKARRRQRRHLPVRQAGADGRRRDARSTSASACTFYYVVLAALAATYALIALLLRSRFGHALAGIRVNEQRMRAAGFATTPYKLAAFVVAGALAGLAGFLLAVKDGAVNPELLSWHESGAVLLMLIFGGIGSLRGAVLGAVAFTLLKELFQSEALFGPLAQHWQLTLGLTIIAFVAALPRGLIGIGAQLRALARERAARAAARSG